MSERAIKDKMTVTHEGDSLDITVSTDDSGVTLEYDVLFGVKMRCAFDPASWQELVARVASMQAQLLAGADISVEGLRD